MIAHSFRNILARDIGKLQDELRAYPDEQSVWLLKGDVKNSAGTLGLHLAGNLKHFIGAVLGRTGYVRQRDREFSDRGVSREELIRGLAETKEVVNAVLSSLPDDKVLSPYPLDNFGKGEITLYVLAQLVAHFEYHLGQVNYHRRLVSA